LKVFLCLKTVEINQIWVKSANPKMFCRCSGFK